MSDSFQLNCPFCEQILEIPTETQGEVSKCPSCNKEIAPDKIKPQATAKEKSSILSFLNFFVRFLLFGSLMNDDTANEAQALQDTNREEKNRINTK